MAKAKKPATRVEKPTVPSEIPIELSPHYRIIYSERSFARVDGNHIVMSFLSRDRRYSGSSVEVTEGVQGYRPMGPSDETDIEIEEVTIRMPIIPALGLSELIALYIRNLDPAQLEALGISVQPAAGTK